MRVILHGSQGAGCLSPRLPADKHASSIPFLSLSCLFIDLLYVQRQVNLGKVSGNPVTSFSGGMKRRLSVALSSVGDPDIIFLDVRWRRRP